jgi:hypothetical protein
VVLNLLHILADALKNAYSMEEIYLHTNLETRTKYESNCLLFCNCLGNTQPVHNKYIPSTNVA